MFKSLKPKMFKSLKPKISHLIQSIHHSITKLHRTKYRNAFIKCIHFCLQLGHQFIINFCFISPTFSFYCQVTFCFFKIGLSCISILFIFINTSFSFLDNCSIFFDSTICKVNCVLVLKMHVQPGSFCFGIILIKLGNFFVKLVKNII